MVDQHSSTRSQADRSSATQRALIDAAYAILLRDGHTTATLVNVAREAGVTRGAIQHHFPGRLDVWLKVLAGTQSRISSLLHFDDIASMPIEARAAIAIDRYWDACAGDDYLVALEIRMMARVDRAFSDEVRSHFREVSRGRDVQWTRLFSDSVLTKRELIAHRALVTDFLRGIAARKATDGADAVRKSDIDLVKQIIMRALAGVRGTTAARPRKPQLKS